MGFGIDNKRKSESSGSLANSRRNSSHRKGFLSGGMLSSLLRNRTRLEVAFGALAIFLLSWRVHRSLNLPEGLAFQEPELTKDETLESPRIPRVIHQSYKTSKLPPVWKDTPQRWKESNPDFEYMFWSDEDNRNLISTDYPWFLETYDSYPYPIQRADSARYFAVLKHGGIYADLDIMPLRDVTPLIDWLSSKEHKDKELLVAETFNLGLTNALFAAVPNSKVLDEFVHDLPNHKHPFGGFEFLVPHFGILLSTGPTRFWIFLNKHREKIVTLAPSGWGQCHQCRTEPGQCTVQPKSYFETTKGGSWHHWDTLMFNSIFCFTQFFIWLVCGALLVVGRWIFNRRRAKGRSGRQPDTLPLANRENRQSMMSTKDRRNSGTSLRTLQIKLTMYRDVPGLVCQALQRREVILYFAVLLALRVL